MGAKSSPARSQEARANAKADRRSGGPAGAPCRAHQEGLPKVWAEICSQPNQSATSGSFFGTKYWKCAESDDGNPKKSMILHRMVPSDTAKSVQIHLPAPPRPKQRVLAPLQDAGGAAGGRRPRPEHLGHADARVRVSVVYRLVWVVMLSCLFGAACAEAPAVRSRCIFQSGLNAVGCE